MGEHEQAEKAFLAAIKFIDGAITPEGEDLSKLGDYLSEDLVKMKRRMGIYLTHISQKKSEEKGRAKKIWKAPKTLYEDKPEPKEEQDLSWLDELDLSETKPWSQP